MGFRPARPRASCTRLHGAVSPSRPLYDGPGRAGSRSFLDGGLGGSGEPALDRSHRNYGRPRPEADAIDH